MQVQHEFRPLVCSWGCWGTWLRSVLLVLTFTTRNESWAHHIPLKLPLLMWVLQHYLFKMLKSKSMPGKPRPLSLPVLLWWRMLLSSFTLSHRFSNCIYITFLYLTTPTYTDIERSLEKSSPLLYLLLGVSLPTVRISTAPQPRLEQPSLCFLSWWWWSTHCPCPISVPWKYFPFVFISEWQFMQQFIFPLALQTCFSVVFYFTRKCRKLLPWFPWLGLSSSALSPLLQVHVCKTGRDWGYWGLNPGPCACSKCSPTEPCPRHIFFFYFETGSVLELLMWLKLSLNL